MLLEQPLICARVFLRMLSIHLKKTNCSFLLLDFAWKKKSAYLKDNSIDNDVKCIHVIIFYNFLSFKKKHLYQFNRLFLPKIISRTVYSVLKTKSVKIFFLTFNHFFINFKIRLMEKISPAKM